MFQKQIYTFQGTNRLLRYVLQLAIADTLFLITWPSKLKAHVDNRWEFPEWMCKVNETILFLNYYASVMFLVVSGKMCLTND